MHAKRLGVGVAVINRLLYAIGGFDGRERLASMECYHPENNAWTILPSMQVGRSGSGVAALNQYIYVVGGFDGSRQLSSVERYDTENQVWDSAQPIKIARSALSLTVLDGKLYAMGGFDGHSFLSIVEVYDPILDKWEEGTPLTSGRSGHASAVIYQPSGASPYMECMENLEQNKKPPCPPDNDNNNGEPSSLQSSKPSRSTNDGSFTSFTGSRCQQCNDGSQISPTLETVTLFSQRPKIISPQNEIVDLIATTESSITEQVAMHTIKSENIMRSADQNISVAPLSPESLMDTESTDSNDWHDADEENPKKCRRKSSDSRGSASGSSSQEPNPMTSLIDSKSIFGDKKCGGKIKSSSCSFHCPISRIKNTFKQNLTDFVSWSSSSSSSAASPSTSSSIPSPSSALLPPTPSPSPSEVLGSSANSRCPSPAGSSSSSNRPKHNPEERKSCLLKKYYKCKMKS